MLLLFEISVLMLTPVYFHSSVPSGSSAPFPFLSARPAVLLLPLGCSTRQLCLHFWLDHFLMGVAQWILSLSSGCTDGRTQQPCGRSASLNLDFNTLFCFALVLRKGYRKMLVFCPGLEVTVTRSLLTAQAAKGLTF